MTSGGSQWTSWGRAGVLRYGKSLRGYREGSGSTRVFGTNGPVGWTDLAPLATGPRPIIGRKGAYRGVHLADGPFWVIDTAYWLEPGPGLDPTWAYYKLLTVDINGMDSGSAIPSLTKAHFERLPLELPPPEEQRRIAAVLRALDRLIEANGQQVGRLEELARAAVANAPLAATLKQLAETVPVGQVKPVGAVEHYSLPAFDDGARPEAVDGDRIQSNKLPLRGPCVLISRLNPKWERCWMVYPGSNAVASTEFVPVVGTDVSSEEVWAVTSTHHFWEQMRTHVTGTTGSHQRVDKGTVLTLTVPDVRVLPDSVRQSVTKLVRTASELRDELTGLTRVRDEVLRLLMSGRVCVSEDLEVA